MCKILTVHLHFVNVFKQGKRGLDDKRNIFSYHSCLLEEIWHKMPKNISGGRRGNPRNLVKLHPVYRMLSQTTAVLYGLSASLLWVCPSARSEDKPHLRTETAIMYCWSDLLQFKWTFCNITRKEVSSFRDLS
jgi:hypothetical protein